MYVFSLFIHSFDSLFKFCLCALFFLKETQGTQNQTQENLTPVPSSLLINDVAYYGLEDFLLDFLLIICGKSSWSDM
jgi:hypothetical protein